MRVALYQPDIPQNTGTILRTAMCLDVAVDVIEPCGFVWSDRHLRRAGLDYLVRADVRRHASWAEFLESVHPPARLLLLTTRGERTFVDFAYRPGDILILGRESAGAPAAVHEAAHERLRIPMNKGCRSLNVAVAGAMVLAEAMRQCSAWPP